MRLRSLLLLVALASLGCGGSHGQGRGKAASDDPRSLIEAGDVDAALARLQSSPASAENQYLQGLAWAKKAATAPLPTPPPPPSPLPRGQEPPRAPEYKPEELKALDLLERAVAEKPDLGEAHLAIAQLLGPHAIRHVEEEQAARAPSRGHRRHAPTPAPTPEGPDAGPQRIVREYRAAIAADPKAVEPVEALIDFCTRTHLDDDGKAAFKELTKREPESSEPFQRFGDYLKDVVGDRDGAIEQYSLALVWAPDDEATRAKIANLYIDMGTEFLDRQEYVWAEQKLNEARKFIKSADSPEWKRLEEQLARLGRIRGRH
jgi:tetratricopeptide (TPR) repeat protein